MYTPCILYLLDIVPMVRSKLKGDLSTVQTFLQSCHCSRISVVIHYKCPPQPLSIFAIQFQLILISLTVSNGGRRLRVFAIRCKACCPALCRSAYLQVSILALNEQLRKEDNSGNTLIGNFEVEYRATMRSQPQL